MSVEGSLDTMSAKASAADPPAEAASNSQSDEHSSPSQFRTTQPSADTLPAPMSHALKSRLSQYSTASIPSRSRPTSHIFPMFPSSLSYTLVRDFAYPTAHPLHYGPPPEPSGPPSGLTTPASEHRRLSDPPVPWDQKMPWDSWTADGFNRGHDLPPIHFGDGPPYSEDEDLQSPVVSTRHHRKHKSTSATMTKPVHGIDPANYDHERGYYVGTAGDGSERYYVGHGGEANGPGGEFVTYPSGEARRSRAYHFSQPAQQDPEETGYDSSAPSSPSFREEDQSRYSRDYMFTITSPDEEFHGKAVALFDFERENENELPLVEGQIIWVSYRHGQGWLVAEDPRTQESGLVPEEYVRLLRDIEGGMNSLTGQIGGDGFGSPNDVGTPTQPDHGSQAACGNPSNGYPEPVVSMFSTSSKDLNPYPTGQLGISTGQAPPQVVHYHGQRGGSQANTPTLTQYQDAGIGKDSHDADEKLEDSPNLGQEAVAADTTASGR